MELRDCETERLREVALDPEGRVAGEWVGGGLQSRSQQVAERQ